MISAEWRTRLSYTAMSLFVAWHTVALVIAPAPANVITNWVRSFMQPYLSLLKLDNRWDFYAPQIDAWRQFRYVIEDNAGRSHAFTPTEELGYFHPNFWWSRGFYDAVMDSPDIYGDYAVKTLCRKHAALHPASITLLKLQVDHGLTPEDYAKGMRPMQPDVAETTTLKHVPCEP